MLTAQNLSKSFGKHKVVDNFSCDIPPATIVGLLGANGAGKTSIMRMLAGYYVPDSGIIRIAGYDPALNPKARQFLGYLPENAPLYSDLTVQHYLQYVQKLKRCTETQEDIESLMDSTQLNDVKYCKISHLSKGYRQRVGLAQALIGKPPILIVDEPTAGLDPLQIQETRQLLKELGNTKTILISTHILSEVEQICDQVIILYQGKIKLFGLLSHLISQYVIITTTAPANEWKQAIAQIQGIIQIVYLGNFTWKLELEKEHDPRTWLGYICASQNWPIFQLELHHTSLEELYLQATTSEKRI